MSLEYVVIFFQIISFLFAISVHESAHAWMANLRGDPTARMLGRITLNPLKHIDPVGTVLLPLIAVLTHIPILGWAKPTPVNPRNFQNPVLDDILTAVVGPVSNFAIALGATSVLLTLKLFPSGREVVEGLIGLHAIRTDSVMVPLCVLFYMLVEINVMLGVFKSDSGAAAGWKSCAASLFAGFDSASLRCRRNDRTVCPGYFGGRFLGSLISPVMGFFDRLLLTL